MARPAAAALKRHRRKRCRRLAAARQNSLGGLQLAQPGPGLACLRGVVAGRTEAGQALALCCEVPGWKAPRPTARALLLCKRAQSGDS